MGFKFKDLLVEEDLEDKKVYNEINEKLEVELNIPNVIEKKKKVVKKT